MDIFDEDYFQLIGDGQRRSRGLVAGTLALLVCRSSARGCAFAGGQIAAALRHNSRCSNSWLYHNRTISVVADRLPLAAESIGDKDVADYAGMSFSRSLRIYQLAPLGCMLASSAQIIGFAEDRGPVDAVSVRGRRAAVPVRVVSSSAMQSDFLVAHQTSAAMVRSSCISGLWMLQAHLNAEAGSRTASGHNNK